MPLSTQMAPYSMNVNTGVEERTRGCSPPRTPNSGVVRKRDTSSHSQNVRPSPRETFLDDSTPIDSAASGGVDNGAGRDSHDLSFSPRHITRDSVVDKMLLSLDQFSSGDAPIPTNNTGRRSSSREDTGDGQLSGTQFSSPTSKGGRSRGHTHSSSWSSEYDLQADESSSRFSSRFARGRRSNSSSNFQSALGRIDSVRAEPYSARGKVFLAQRAAAPGERQLPTHLHGGKKGSKSSGSSVDFGRAQTLGLNSWASPTRQRSSSFDYGQGDRNVHEARSNMIADSLISNGKVDPASIIGYDAAPTPVVRVGPRKRHSPPPISYPSRSIYAPPQAPPLTRDTSYNSLLRSQGVDEGIAITNATNRKGRPNEFQGSSNSRELPPLPAFVDPPPAPSPTTSRRKPSIPLTQEVTYPPKERPGFFRRVFGSSRNHTPTVCDLYPSQMSRAQTPMSMYNDHSGDTSHPHVASQVNLSSKEQIPKQNLPGRKEQSPPLTKKTSSFFRRRKKSVSEHTAPPATPLQLQTVRDAERATQSSPVSSLRKVMDPYIKSPVGSPQYFYDSKEHFDMNEENKSGLTQRSLTAQLPYRDAPGKEVESEPRDHKEKTRASSSANGTNPIRNHPVDARDVIDDSFLQDSSGNEEKGGHFNSSNKKLPPIPAESMFTKGIKWSNENEKQHKISRKGENATVNNPNAEITIPKSSWRHPNFLRSTHAQTPVAISQVDKPIFTTEPSEPTDDTIPASPDEQTKLLEESKSSEKQLSGTKRLRKISGLTLPLEGTKESAKVSPSSSSDYRSASSLPIASNEDDDTVRRVPEICEPVEEAQPVNDSEPTNEDRERAKRIFDGDHDFVGKAGAAAWLGESSSVSARTRKAYMELFDASNMNILAALKAVCERLVIKAETQQVDRILDAFSTRWCECNPSHGFKATGKLAHDLMFSDESKGTTDQFRCGAYHLLLHSFTQHRSACCRH